MLTFGRTYTSTQVPIYMAEHTHVYVKADCNTQYILQVWTLALTKHHFYYFYSKAECLSSPKLMILSSLSKCYSTTNIHFQFEHQHKNINHENPQPNLYMTLLIPPIETIFVQDIKHFYLGITYMSIQNLYFQQDQFLSSTHSSSKL